MSSFGNELNAKTLTYANTTFRTTQRNGALIDLTKDDVQNQIFLGNAATIVRLPECVPALKGKMFTIYNGTAATGQSVTVQKAAGDRINGYSDTVNGDIKLENGVNNGDSITSVTLIASGERTYQSGSTTIVEIPGNWYVISTSYRNTA